MKTNIFLLMTIFFFINFDASASELIKTGVTKSNDIKDQIEELTFEVFKLIDTKNKLVVINISNLNKANDSCEFSVRYIMNEFEIENLKPKYFIYINKSLVLIESIFEVQQFNTYLITKSIMQEARKKVAPSKELLVNYYQKKYLIQVHSSNYTIRRIY